MSHKFLESIKLGNVEVKNRVIYLAMAKAMAGFDNMPSLEDIEYIRTVAQGGAGLIIPGGMMTDIGWPSGMPMAIGIYADKFIPRLTKLAEAGHENGAKILFQLWHGGQVSYDRRPAPTINEIDQNEIHRIQKSFFEGAERAMKAGADGIEFQICHTYLANQFASPLWNHRTDEYGCQTIESRMRFSVECLEGIRKVIGPDKILAVKLQGFDFPEGEGIPVYGSDGINPDMAAEMAKYVEAAGADLITVSAGGALTGRDDIMTGDVHRPEGWKVDACRKVKAAVSIPVAASGNIRHPEYVDRIMAEGACDMVGMGRGLFAEREWVNKCAAGKENTLRYCISCMNCWNTNPFAKSQSNCSVNPFARRETDIRPLKKDGAGRVVVIVGAGPAGMEAAVTLKQRGFEPVVFEQSDRIGGNLHIAKKPPFKGKFDWACGYYANMAEELGIDVRLGQEATVEKIEALDPYCTVIAAGSNVTVPPVPGLEQATVLQSRDILDQDMQFAGKKMPVIGGGITGLETALYLNAQGIETCVVDFAPMFPLQMGDPRFMEEAMLETKHCMEKGIPLHYDNKVAKYEDGKLYLENVNTGEGTVVDADIVVLSTGVKPNDALYGALLAKGKNVWKIGDANMTAKIVNAVQAGSKFAIALK